MNPAAGEVVVGSTNPVKLAAVRLAFARAFADRFDGFTGIDVASGVPSQPFGQAETLRGADNRAAAARARHPGAAYWVGIEGGVEESAEGLVAGAWIVVLGPTVVGRGATARFVLPSPVADRVRGGMELGAAVDEIYGRTNVKQAEGAIGLLSAGAMDRTTLYAQGVIAALLPVISVDLYAQPSP